MEQLTVFHPPQWSGVVLRLSPGRQLLGRGSRNALRFDDQHLSITHAVISNVGGRVTVEDLGSSTGTRIGGETFSGAKLLHHGDVVTFGRIQARFQQSHDPRTEMLAREDIHRAAPSHARYDIEDQTAHQVNNVARDQNNNYSLQRESFLREAAASRTKARYVFWTGLVLAISGSLGYAYLLVKGIEETQTETQELMDELDSSWQSGEPPAHFPGFGTDFTVLGTDTGLGISAESIFFLVAMVGDLMTGVGLILWIVAAARARSVYTDPRHVWNQPFDR
ncbi:FHA domain-containing protein [Nocardia noduli]|uniref:FHA domain-containing protein n=1 Tax=Nocardia noduli TaxID=2815722 RepID=UPI001C21FCCC|nr:FHA domain-containing protein [Nocardia noduli]